MKPKELVEKFDLGTNGQAQYHKTYYKYYDDNCVVAYSVNDLGVFILIKGAIKYFNFVFLRTELSYFGGYGFNMKIFDNINFTELNNVIVVNEEQYKTYKDKLLLDKL